ncbi:MAG: DUF4372 domain-containing protein, partial [Lentisphaeria bacterium]|nr:DUF4372 domain-containing protein [Lentisphaeria bacterium]
SGGDRYCKHFTAWKQFLTLLFAQISGKDSLREMLFKNSIPNVAPLISLPLL